ncbi:hypothetical protein BU23DRAFT_548863 [Bimuria novae-zelandiae CBS 107.79]|uniref:Uncharacterized protein n=1 Tax=Bimuria novae-zelandiae CBS 107.79 TaxID=1447943 RepID=A0A6A5VQZ9_9PLEO|nr:hypothetical protein BU23DRAFT_548863 [Bimuria novae-zelandiae CBS 107.79]
MPTLPRTSLASLVCPSAPFLAPRLLRTYTPLAALPSQCLLLPTPGRRHNSTGKTFRKTKVNERQVQQRQLLGHVVEVRQQLRQACDDRDLKALMDLYPSFIATGHLQSRDETRKIAQALHVCARTQTAGRVPFESVLPFIQQVIEDIKKGSLPPHPMAFVHLLGIYRDRKMYDEGYALWQWLSQQDDNYLSQAVYGAAIELLAYSRQVRLPELENLYLDALQRFPGTFAQYHLSPDAIVPDRGQPTLIANLPITLLQGITTARIFHNDWKNAYLALDTALRLYPAQLPARFFELFVYNRPLEEGYTAFLVACRAGIIIPPGYLSGLIAKIRKAMEHCDLLRDRAVLLRAIANATYAYLQAGGSLQPIHVAAFLTSFGSLLPEPASGENYEGDMASIRNIIVTRAHETLSTWFQAGLPPSPNAFTALINLAGRLRVPDLLRVSLHDIETAQVNIGDIGLRTVLTSAGQTGAKDLIEETWASIVHKADSMGRQIDWRDWICLSKACRRAQHLDYFNAQLSEQEHAIPTPYKDMIVETLDNELPHTETTMQSLNPDAFETQFAELNQQIKNITAVVMSGQRLNIQQNPFYMSLDPEKLPLANILVLRDVYNEYTVDPHQPPAEDATPFRSSTGIPLDELRFANWVSVVEMMDQADKLDKERREAIRRTGSDVTQATTKNPLRNTHNSIISLDRLRKRIKSLREVPAPSTY